MKCIPDYSIVLTVGRKVLCIGGAISTDRKHRRDAMWIDQLKNRTVRPLYWEKEGVIFNAQALSELRDMKIDTLITHTCPSFCYPLSKNGIESWLLQDAELLGDLNAERSEVDKIYNQLIIMLDYQVTRNNTSSFRSNILIIKTGIPSSENLFNYSRREYISFFHFVMRERQ